MTKEHDKVKVIVSVPALFLGVLTLYLISLLAVAIDEGMLGTFFISRHAPDWVGQAFRTIYSPFFWPLGSWPLILGL